MAKNPGIHGDDIIPYAIEENVWQGIEDLFMSSPSTRNAVKDGKVKVIGAIYDVGTGRIKWLPENNVSTILASVESNPQRAMNAMASSGHEEKSGASGHDGGHTPAVSVSTSHGESQSHGSSTSYASSAATSKHTKSTTAYAGAKTEVESTSLMDAWWFWAIIFVLMTAGIAFALKQNERGQFLPKMKIRTKVLAGFTIMVLLLGLSIGIAELKMSIIGADINHIAEIYVPLTTKVSEIEVDALEGELALNAYLIDHHPERVAIFHEHDKKARQEMSEAERIIQSDAYLVQSGFLNVIKDLEKEHDEFAKHAEELLALFDSRGSSDSRYLELYERVEGEAGNMTVHIEELLVGIEHQLDSVAVKAEHEERAAFSLLMIIGFGALLMAGVIGWLVSQSIARPVNMVVELTEQMNGEFQEFSAVVDKIAANDLAQEIKISNYESIGIKSQDEVGQLVASIENTLDVKNNMGNAMNRMIENLNNVIRQINDGSVQLVSAASEIASTSEQASRGAQDQSRQVEQISSAIQEMTATILQASKNTSEANEVAQGAADTATSGGQIVSQTILGMEEVTKSADQTSGIVNELATASDKIGEIVTVIDDIADQTNLLALNAAIEAARAGEQGRGFAVVADEVRKLAERTGRATGEITDMIKGIQDDTERAVASMDAAGKVVEGATEKVNQAGGSLNEIVSMNQKVMDMISQVATASEQQSSAAEQISRTIEQVSSVTIQSAKGAEQSAAAAEELNQQAESMKQMVSRFKIKETTSA